MSEKRLRAGVIGLGVGKWHVEGYFATPAASLVALCDVNEERLTEYATEFRVPPEACFTDYETMLAQMELDVVSVCLPNALHAPATIAALNAGAHVICEKPLSTSTSEARQMVDAANAAARHIMLAYKFRYRDDTRWLHNVMQSGRLGRVYHVSASWRRELGIPGSGWFGNRQLAGGGSLIDLGVHVLDMTLWLLGFPKVLTVSGNTRSEFGPRALKTWGRRRGEAVEGFDVEDGAVGFIRLENGVSVALEATWAEHAQPQDDRLRVEVQGTEGTAVLNIPNYTFQDTLRLYMEMEDEPVTITPRIRWDKPHYEHKALIIDEVERIANGQQPSTTGEQGLIAVQVLEALYESARAGHEISLKDEETYA